MGERELLKEKLKTAVSSAESEHSSGSTSTYFTESSQQTTVISSETEVGAMTSFKQRLQDVRQLIVNLQEEFTTLENALDTIETTQKETNP